MYQSAYDKMNAWKPPSNWLKITTIDAHTGGEPLRIITSGFPELTGKTILDRRQYAKEKYDSLRTALMWEPRGHADMYGCILTPPTSVEADFGVLFLHNEGYSTMCGHAIIAITKVALESGMIQKQEPETKIKIDTPAGIVKAFAKIENDKVQSVCFHNVASFVVELDTKIDVPGLGKINYDLAFGGAYYAFVRAEAVGLKCTPDYFQQLIETGMMVKRAVMENRKIEHPYEKELNFLYGTIFIDASPNKNVDSRNVCIFAEGEVDRSPTGTGVSARMAIHYSRGDIGINQPMTIESIIGSRFTGRVVRSAQFGPYPAVIPQVEGMAYITGKNEFYIDPDDPLKHGFILR